MRTTHPAINAMRLRRLVPVTLVAAGAIGGFAMFAAPAANALPESQIQSDCTQSGGHYETTVRKDGSRVSVCCPTGAPGEISGGKCSIYVDGVLSAMQGGGSTNPTNPVVRLPLGPRPTTVLAPRA
ncbi:MAG TPA: hypothetical protein VH496_10250 [Mycobacterium sp.]|jgi:hypothetical protein